MRVQVYVRLIAVVLVPGMFVVAPDHIAYAGVPEGYILSDKAPVQGKVGLGMNGRQTWELNNHQDYSYTLEQTCYCVLPKRVQVYVIGGRVVQVDDLKTGRVHTEPDMLGSFLTINGYFKLIDQLLAGHPDSITIQHNRYHGYPEVIKANPSYRMADEETDYRISELKFLHKR